MRNFGISATPGNHARLVNATLLRGIDGRDDDRDQFIRLLP